MISNDIVESIDRLDDKTVRVIFKEKVVIDLENIKKTYAQLHELTGNQPHKKLIISGKFTEITKEARIFGMQENKRISNIVKAEAIVVHSLYQKMVINFYYQFIGTSIPVRLFTDKDKAIEWLNTQNW